MKKLYDKIIYDINKDLEEIAKAEDYKPEERALLLSILQCNSYFNINMRSNFLISGLILAAAIMNEQYEDLNDVYEKFNRIEKYIDMLDFKELGLLVEGFLNAKDSDGVEEYREKNKKKLKYRYVSISKSEMPINGNDLYDTFLSENYGIAENKSIEDFVDIKDIIDIFNLIDSEILAAVPRIKEFYAAKKYTESKSKLMKQRTIEGRNKVYLSLLKEAYDDYEEVISKIKKISEYYITLENKNNLLVIENNKKAHRLSELKKILEESKNKMEITNINSIINLLDEKYEEDVLKYIALKNQKYYKLLKKEYDYTVKNSVSSYIKLFNDYGINFNTYSKKVQQSILNLDLDELKQVFKFLEKIEYKIEKNIKNILLNINNDIIEQVDEYIKNGVLTTNFIKNNIKIIYDKSLYDKVITNIKLLSNNKINVINLEEESLNVFLGDSNLIMDNLEYISLSNINIKTRNLTNYIFLLDEKLTERITKLQDLGININNNIEVLNSDYNIVKRIELCNSINIDIYVDGKIKDEILNKELFFIPDSDIDKYVKQKILL